MGLDTPFLLLVLVAGVVLRVAVLDVTALLLFVLFCAACVVSFLLNGRPLSLPPFVIVVLLYVTFCFRIQLSEEKAWRIADHFQRIMLVIAGIVIAQQVMQYTIGRQYWPNLNRIIPESLQYTGFAYLRPYAWNSPNLKPNGVFFLEPSGLSAAIGFALLFELIRYRRPVRIAVYAVAMLATLATSGPLIFVIALPLLLTKMNVKMLATIFVGGVLLLAVAAPTGLLDPFLSRTNELSDPQSSGYARIMLPLQDLSSMVDDPGKVFYGEGPGTSVKAANVVQWPLSKLTREYGLLAAIIFHLFVMYALFANPLSRTVSFAIFIPYAVFGGGFVTHSNIMMMVMLATLLWPDRDRFAALEDDPPRAAA